MTLEVRSEGGRRGRGEESGWECLFVCFGSRVDAATISVNYQQDRSVVLGKKESLTQTLCFSGPLSLPLPDSLKHACTNALHIDAVCNLNLLKDSGSAQSYSVAKTHRMPYL